MAELDMVGAAGDSPGFRDLFEAHFGRLVGLARLLGSDDPEDTAAEGFARLYRAWGALRDEHAALGYVRATVTRLCSNRRRHLAVVDRHLQKEMPVNQDAAELSALSRFDQELVTALGALTDARRTAVVLRYYADLSHEQIGDVMQCSTSTARAHVHRGLADLRRACNEEGETV